MLLVNTLRGVRDCCFFIFVLFLSNFGLIFAIVQSAIGELLNVAAFLGEQNCYCRALVVVSAQRPASLEMFPAALLFPSVFCVENGWERNNTIEGEML
jgi:hypothetical protein